MIIWGLSGRITLHKIRDNDQVEQVIISTYHTAGRPIRDSLGGWYVHVSGSGKKKL